MDMDKRTLLAFVLIFFVLIAVQYYYSSKQPPKTVEPKTEKVIEQQNEKERSESVAEARPDIQKQEEIAKEIISDSLDSSPFVVLPDITEQEIIVETDKYYGIISNKGATIKSWCLKEYAKPNSVNNGDSVPDSDRVDLIGPPEKYFNDNSPKGYGNLGIYLPVKYGTGDTSPFLFNANKTRINLTDTQASDSVIFVLPLKNGGAIKKKYIFYADKYDFDIKVELENITDSVIFQPYYRLEWQSGLASTEINIEEEMEYSKAYILTGTELTKEDVPDKEDEIKPIIGQIGWIATTTKYFTSAIIPKNKNDLKAYLNGEKIKIDNEKELYWKKYNLSLEIPINSSNKLVSSFKVYLGPLDYFIMKGYDNNLEKLIYLGWEWLRPVSIGILYCFVFLHSFISNYGLVLIIFSILVKIVLYPLTKKSMDSMKGMQELKPELDALKEKHGKDAQKMNKETMRLYKEKGVNPAAGCLPMILQMPILFSLYQVFRITIELRGEPFIWWIKDLSMPDTIFTLPFTVPFYGDQFNVLPIVMGVTMFIQQKMTVQDPKQKMMVYMMPVFMTALFNRFSSGLNLYYTLFNVLSVLQQKYFPTSQAKKDEDDKKNINVVKKNDIKSNKTQQTRKRKKK